MSAVSTNYKQNEYVANTPRVLACVGTIVSLLALIVLAGKYLDTAGTSSSVTPEFQETCLKVASYSAISTAGAVGISLLRDAYSGVRSRSKKAFLEEAGYSLASPILGLWTMTEVLSKK